MNYRAAVAGFGVALWGVVATWAGEAAFTTKPSLRKMGDRHLVSFALAAPADVEVSVLAGTNVVRHLAAGLLGGAGAPPAPLQPGLAQTLTWDGKDDMGRAIPAASGPLSFRVRAGMKLAVGGFVGGAETLESKSYGLATDDKGELYVATGGGYGGYLFTIKVFDRTGAYLRTIFPYPATLQPGDVQGFGPQTLRDDRLNPPQYNALLPWIYPHGLGSLVGNRVRNGVLWLTSGSGRLGRIRAADGACLAWNVGAPPAPPAGGPICWAAAPDGKTLFLAGWRGSKPGEEDGQIFKVDPATGARSSFVKIDVPTNCVWRHDPNGWYNFTNWGRKNGQSAFHGLDVDLQGRLYACDRVRQRLAVYDASGKELGGTPVAWPDHVVLSPRGEEIYVVTRRIIDGYKAVNEFRIVKLSGWKDGKVLAELTLKGNNASSCAVDATAQPAVIWLSNVGDGGSITRVEDRGAEFVVTGRLNEKSVPMPGAVVKVWADPLSDNVILSDGWSAQMAYDGLTGAPQPWPLKGMELAFDRDGNYYVYGQTGWHELVTRFDRSFKPLPFPATGKNTTTMTTTGKDVYGRYGHGWCNKGLCVAPSGRIHVYNMYDWAKYFVNVWDATGQAEKHGRPGDGLLGPLDSQGGGLRVDFAGNVYVGMHGYPRALGKPGRDDGAGTVVKFPPAGGGYVANTNGLAGIAWQGGLQPFIEGGTTAYPGLAPQVQGGCVCKEARFDLDGWGRLYIPNALTYSMRVTDNAGNEIARCGHYGNADSRGPGSKAPDPDIAFGWPMAVSAGQIERGRLYVADVLNHRAARLQVSWQTEERCVAP